MHPAKNPKKLCCLQLYLFQLPTQSSQMLRRLSFIFYTHTYILCMHMILYIYCFMVKVVKWLMPATTVAPAVFWFFIAFIVVLCRLLWVQTLSLCLPLLFVVIAAVWILIVHQLLGHLKVVTLHLQFRYAGSALSELSPLFASHKIVNKNKTSNNNFSWSLAWLACGFIY